METQVTSGAYGHTLNATQVFSPDGKWIVYDTRNADTHIARTDGIEKVNIETGETVRLYTTENQTLYGPGVGAAAWNPVDNRIVFIHGLVDCNERKPYGFTRRFGALVDADHAGPIFRHAEARRVDGQLLPGTSRGGTHAHSWSGDGQWISFTYNDFLMASLEQSSRGKVRDLRTVGVMISRQPVAVSPENADNFSGTYFTVIAADVTETPAPGSDEIDRAFDECWIGDHGYTDNNGQTHPRAIAFQGNVRAVDGTTVTEVFVADLVDGMVRPGTYPLEGTPTSRQGVPVGWSQRRVTFTTTRKHPGIQGPRVRLRTSPDGSTIYFPMKDDQGIVQLFAVPTVGGDVRQLTQLQYSIQWQFNVSPDGGDISMIAGNRIWIFNLSGGVIEPVTKRHDDATAPVTGALWSPSGKTLVYNRYVPEGDTSFLQIFKVDLLK
jgi:WD40 repeat protein